MSTSSPTHYCWIGCGCMEEAMRREQPGALLDIKFGTIEINAGRWDVDPFTPEVEKELDDRFNATMLAVCGPQLLGELMQGLLWFLLDDE